VLAERLAFREARGMARWLDGSMARWLAAWGLRSVASDDRHIAASAARLGRMLPNLPRVARPYGALAVVTQSRQSYQTTGPRGMSLDPKFTKKRTYYGPTPCSSPHLRTMLDAYLSTRSLCYAKTPGEAASFLRCENAELVQAARNLPSADDGLAPRAVGVVLLIYGPESTCSTSARTYLDAMGHFAASLVNADDPSSPLVASTMRFTVLAGADAEWFAQQVESQMLNSSPDIGAGKINVCVRWAVQGDSVTLRTELTSLRPGSSFSSALEQVQNFLLSMKLVYEVPISDDITRSHTQIVPDCWAHTLHDATFSFFDSMEGKPCVVKSTMLLQHEQEVSVESTDVFLRIAPRRCWDHTSEKWVNISAEMAAQHPDAFHAFLIGNAAYMQEIVKFCQTHASGGLPASDDDSEVYLLHTCAVQSTPMHFKQAVSLYGVHAGPGRVPGTPISQPGSMMWRFDPAIVPLDDVLRDFHVLPCSRSSAMPADPKLERPFTSFFDRAFSLYTSFVGGAGVAKEPGLKRVPSLPLLSDEPGDAALKTCELYALTSFGLNATSQNLTTGDAYAVLKASGAPKQLTDFMLSSCVSNGVNSSVLDALGSAAAALQKISSGYGADHRDAQEQRRLKRVADASLRTSLRTSMSKKQRPMSPAVEMEAARVKSLLAASGLIKGEETVLHYKEMQHEGKFAQVVDVVAYCVAPKANDQSRMHAMQAARAASRKGVLQALSSIICVLRACPGAKIAPAFVVRHDLLDEDKIQFSRVLPCGGFENCTPGAIVDTPMAVVLIVRTGKSVRITGTLRG